MDIDPAAAALLGQIGWTPPPAAEHPTGNDLVERYLEPLAAHPAIGPQPPPRRHRHRGDPPRTQPPRHRRPRPGTVRGPVRADGVEHEFTATAVVDASGTWTTPNPLGAAGIPARGEQAASARIRYGIPDVLGADRARYASKRVAVAGGGHSAANVLLDLAAVAATAPGTKVTWLLRRPGAARLVGGGANDELPERGRLGTAVDELVAERVIAVEHGFRDRQRHRRRRRCHDRRR